MAGSVVVTTREARDGGRRTAAVVNQGSTGSRGIDERRAAG
jgi:hypothetical protein